MCVSVCVWGGVRVHVRVCLWVCSCVESGVNIYTADYAAAAAPVLSLINTNGCSYEEEDTRQTISAMPPLFDKLGEPEKGLIADQKGAAGLNFALVSRECRDLMFECRLRRGWQRQRSHSPLGAVQIVSGVESLRHARDLNCLGCKNNSCTHTRKEDEVAASAVVGTR